MEIMKDVFEDRLEKRAREVAAEIIAAAKAEVIAEAKAEAMAEAERETAVSRATGVRLLMDRLSISREDAMDAMKVSAKSRAGVMAFR